MSRCECGLESPFVKQWLGEGLWNSACGMIYSSLCGWGLIVGVKVPCYGSWSHLHPPQIFKETRILASLDKINQKRTLHPHRFRQGTPSFPPNPTSYPFPPRTIPSHTY